MCLTGVDYFSTLAYQPSTAYKNAGLLGPFATIVLVLVTLLGALPVYGYVAGKSHSGQGSIGMLARLVPGWPGKILVLVLLGFAATDFVITKTLSAADASEHLIQNSFWPLNYKPSDFNLPQSTPGEASEEDKSKIFEQAKQSFDIRQRLVVTSILLMLLGAMFMKGFREVIGLAVFLVGGYLILSLIVVGSGLIHIAEHPDKITTWLQRVNEGNWYLEQPWTGSKSFFSILILSIILFPKLALGLSGFETGVAVMPLIKGNKDDNPEEPFGRIRNTKKLLITAAVVMSAFLLASSLVCTTLIEPIQILAMDENGVRLSDDDAKDKGIKPAADGRALAFLAHAENGEKLAPFFGDIFGTIYDMFTIVILWFAGASAMAGLLNLVPQYLPKYGMAPEWARAIRPLVLLFTFINLVVTLIFKADVDAQSDAYATGVLVLITSACVAAVIDIYRERNGAWYKRISWPFFLITIVFCYTTAALILEKPVGLHIAGCFIGAVLVTSFASRVYRSRELRFSGFYIPDGESKLYWDTIKHLELSVLVPHRPGRRSLASKELAIRQEHRIPRDITIIFVEVVLLDASEFLQEPTLEIRFEDGRYVMKISRAASIAHTLAALSLEMAKYGRPPEIHFGWTEERPLTGTLGFLLFGEGNIPWMVRELLRRAEPNEEKRPRVIIAGA